MQDKINEINGSLKETESDFKYYRDQRDYLQTRQQALIDEIDNLKAIN